MLNKAAIIEEMSKYKCPWCGSKGATKQYVQSHMRVCSRAPAKYKNERYSDSSSDLLFTSLIVDAISDSVTSFGSDSSYSGGGGDSGGGGASGDF